jgi:hypothetical protein
MTYAWKAADGRWIEVVGETTLPNAHSDGDWTIRDSFVASFDDAWRAAQGFVAVVEVAQPLGVVVTGSTVIDNGGVPTRHWLVEGLSADQLAALLQHRKDEVDAYATAQIGAALGPAWKQLDLICQAVSLIDAAQNGSLTLDQQAQRTQLRATLAFTVAARAHAEALKGELPADDGPALAAFDITAGWPAPPA